ncbi:poly-beta-1,6-N-acetyl-D-glucosamine N-deacetylase PgaB [Candidatus Methylobacter oryzae]|uniref:Poly-beta-1,6-N-acetyl-D-glucosamine N-deacetylase PgaB n=1 Tax=Candidatus Methylobacter oryzae TaxID=2497749 RepID=A0ABY3CAC4_9GAMM|nr:poly-beta-1,6-N-acetyl-D-glucosamine N-deacetylase PgaB [Candidatus Methylobacter oryzae]TRW95122.1 poly-beta-1,6-N-acetyl-D-glucosamine N-deacetylase PgaB [Candidatus Methylobacter oryzae]
MSRLNIIMLSKLFKLIFLLGFLAKFAAVAHAEEHHFIVLNYHDIVKADSPRSSLNAMDVSVDHFEEHLLWLKKNGYKIVSVQNVLDAAAGKNSIPDKSVLLTFDDGYQSFYTRVFPLLKKYHYPATVALIGTWIEGIDTPDEAGKQLLNWSQVREMVKSGLVEMASHTYDLHKSVVANPQNDAQAAAVTRLYDPAAGRYETEEQYRERIHLALRKSAEFIFQHAGVWPRVMVWPYGEYNSIALEASREAGMPMTMGLIDGFNTVADIDVLRRLIMTDNPDVRQFAEIVGKLRTDRPLRVARLDMDFLYDKNPKQTELNIEAEVQRIANAHINTVFLQAYSDSDGDGNADALYFPNPYMPVKQDLLNHVAWQLKTRAGVNVYAWLPVFAYQNGLPDAWYVQQWKDGKAQKSNRIYTRLSVFQPEARHFITGLYEDLGQYCNVDGILFHQDGVLSDYEDVSAVALAFGHDVWGLPDQFEKLHSSPQMRMAWAQHKNDLINQFTDELANRVRANRPPIKTARKLHALPLLKSDSEEWPAQSFKAELSSPSAQTKLMPFGYKSFLAHYDYVVIESTPAIEKTEKPEQWLTQLVDAAARYPEGLKKSVFELQTVNWETREKIPSPLFIEQLELLRKLRVHHIGYYPDDVYLDQPRLKDLQKYFSLPALP